MPTVCIVCCAPAGTRISGGRLMLSTRVLVMGSGVIDPQAARLSEARDSRTVLCMEGSDR